MVQFCSWENMQLSMVVINELLIEVRSKFSSMISTFALEYLYISFMCLVYYQIGSVQAFDMRPYLDLLMHLLLLQDTFQKHRLLNSLRGKWGGAYEYISGIWILLLIFGGAFY